MDNIIKALEKNNIEAHYFDTAREIYDYIEEILPAGAKIANGGAQSLIDSGVMDLIKKEKYNYIDRFAVSNADEERKIKADYFTADYFFCSTNALTENGELVNVDGRSNRVAAIMYGPTNVIMIVGKNKIVKDIKEAFLRVKTVAAPKNTVRLNCDTYCKEKGMCVAAENGDIASGCGSSARICCNYVVSAYQREKNRIKVLICGENLGF